MGLMDYGMDGWGNTGGMDDEPYRPGLLGSIKNWAAQDKNKFAIAQMLQAMSQPAQGRNSTASTLGTIANMLGAYNQANLGGYDAYKQQADMKKMQLDEMTAQAEQRKAQTQALQAKAAQDQRAQGIVGGLTKQWASPNQGMTTGPTTPEYAANANAFKSQPPMNPADRYQSIADALETQGMLDHALKYREEGRKLSPQVEKIDTVMVGGVPRQVSYFKDGTYKVIDGIAPTPKVRYENIGGQILPIDEYTQQFGKPINRTQSPDSIASNQVTMRGQNMTDARARESAAITAALGNRGAPAGYRWTAEGNLAPIPGGPAAEGKPLTDAQSKAYLFGDRMLKSGDIVNQLAAQGVTQPSIGQQMLGDRPILGRVANAIASPQQQQIEQAQRDFINATLRRESGAVISPEEFENAKRQYFVQPKDSPEVIEQKRKNRETATQGILMEVPENRRPKREAAPTGGGYSDPDKEARYQAWKRSQGM